MLMTHMLMYPALMRNGINQHNNSKCSWCWRVSIRNPNRNVGLFNVSNSPNASMRVWGNRGSTMIRLSSCGGCWYIMNADMFWNGVNNDSFNDHSTFVGVSRSSGISMCLSWNYLSVHLDCCIRSSLLRKHWNINGHWWKTWMRRRCTRGNSIRWLRGRQRGK